MTTKSLHDLRNDIDAIDKKIVALLNKRAVTAQTIGNLKNDSDMKVYDPKREKSVLKKIDTLNTGPLSKGSIEDIYATIITACREIQIKP